MLAAICLIHGQVKLINKRRGTQHKVELHEPVVGAHIFMILACSASYVTLVFHNTSSSYYYRTNGALCILDNALTLMLSAIITNIIWEVEFSKEQE
jgi:hypothetical protein